MPKKKHKSRRHDSEVELWARALGVSPQRFLVLVEEVVRERLSLTVPLVPAEAPTQQ
jgi:hypothetical protein